MQTNWKRIGAVLGSALMIGATLAGAAFAQDDDTGDETPEVTEFTAPSMGLGDYKELMIVDGSVEGLFVMGADAATADVVSAMDMAAYIANQETTGVGGGSGMITLTQTAGGVEGVKRHVEIGRKANESYEFASASTTDTIGPSGVGSSDGVVSFLYSYRDKGALYINSTEKYWEEKIQLTTTSVEAKRDDSNLVSEVGDQYDEVVLSVDGDAIKYRYDMKASDVTYAQLRGKKIHFMGKEYTIISATASTIKLGASDGEIVLTTANPTSTIGGIDVTLGGIYSATSNTYKAKVTVTSGTQTETKYVSAGETQTVAGIEVYVKDAVVTTTGTNEGEAQMVVGAGILKLDDGDYLTRGDNVETTWRVDLSGASVLDYIDVIESQSHTTWTGDWPILHAGDGITSPNDLFMLKYNGLTDQYGNPIATRTVYVQPDYRDVTGDSTSDRTVRVRTPDGDYITFGAAAGTLYKNEVWYNTSGANWVYKDTSSGTTSYLPITSGPNIEMKVGTTMGIGWSWVNATDSELGTISSASSTAPRAVINITEPALSKTSTVGAFYIELVTNQFTNTTSVVGEAGSATYLSHGSIWVARTGSTTTNTRDYYSNYGTKVTSAGQSGITLEVPEGQAYAEFMVGSESSDGVGTSVEAGGTVVLSNIAYTVDGSVSGNVPVALPTTIAKIDADVTDDDKASFTLVLVGGPAVNTLVAELQVTDKMSSDVTGETPGPGMGILEVVEDAFVEGQFAVVVAGSDRAGTGAAADVLANYDDYMDELEGEYVYTAG